MASGRASHVTTLSLAVLLLSVIRWRQPAPYFLDAVLLQRPCRLDLVLVYTISLFQSLLFLSLLIYFSCTYYIFFSKAFRSVRMMSGSSNSVSDYFKSMVCRKILYPKKYENYVNKWHFFELERIQYYTILYCTGLRTSPWRRFWLFFVCRIANKRNLSNLCVYALCVKASTRGSTHTTANLACSSTGNGSNQKVWRKHIFVSCKRCGKPSVVHDERRAVACCTNTLVPFIQAERSTAAMHQRQEKNCATW